MHRKLGPAFLCAIILATTLLHAQQFSNFVPVIEGLPPAARTAAASVDSEKIRAQLRFLSLDQPSDEYRADWDFRSNAKLARFGFVLGWLASGQNHPIEWIPGDEFEADRKASEKGN
jgi:hypothetical protein